MITTTIILVTLVLCSLATAQIIDENKDAVIINAEPTLEIQNRLFIVNRGQTCVCVLAGTCTGANGNNGIDIRIVNVQMTTTSTPMCASGFEYCCTLPTPTTTTTTTTTTATTTTPAPIMCGVRKIPVTPQTVVGQASYGAYPWQVVILTKGSPTYYLGSGVLMDATHVVTAAHKIAAYANNPDGIVVRLGDWNLQVNTEPYLPVTANVARVTLHPSFNPVNLENDVAVIRLNGVVPIASSPNINTACPPTGLPAAGQRCYVSGWGQKAFTDYNQLQSIMREVDVPIVDQAVCESRFRQTRLGANFVLSRTSFICAGGEAGKDACTGDGGSPLVCQTSTGQWQVVGLVAWGIGCANTNVPGVYTNLWNFLPWIKQVIATV